MKIILFILWLIVITGGAFTFPFVPASYQYIYGFFLGTIATTMLNLMSV